MSFNNIKGKFYSIAREYTYIGVIILFLGVAGVLLPRLYGFDNIVAGAVTFDPSTKVAEDPLPGEYNTLNFKKIDNVYYLVFPTANYGAGSLKMVTSSDGEIWSSAYTINDKASARDIDFGYYENGGYFYAVFSNYNYLNGYASTEIVITTSSDAITWSSTSTVASVNTGGAHLFLSPTPSSTYLTLGYYDEDNGVIMMATSTNGVDWTSVEVLSSVFGLSGFAIGGDDIMHALYGVPTDLNFNTSTEVYLEYARSIDGGINWTTSTIGRTDYQLYFFEKTETLTIDNDGNPGVVYYKVDSFGEGCTWDDVDESWIGDCDVTVSLHYAKYDGMSWSSSTATTFLIASTIGIDVTPKLVFAQDNEALFAGAGPNSYPYLIINTNTLDINQFGITQIDNKAMIQISPYSVGIGLVYDTSTLGVGFVFIGDDGSATDSDIWFAQSSAVVVPFAPTGLTATPSTTTQIDLAWDNVGGATSYILYRDTDSGFSATTTVTTTALTSYSDTGLSASTQYYYKVAATNAVGASTPSSAVNTTTLAGAPAYDGNLPTLPSGSKQKLVYTDDLYYLAFTSSTDDLFDIYITTSTSGVDGTWSEPTVISPENIKIDGENGVMLFDFVYNTTANDFGLAYVASTTGITYFTTSTNAISWSTGVSTISPVGGYLSFDYKGNNVLVVSKNNTLGIHSSRSSYSTDGGSTWVTSTVFSRDVSGAGDPSSEILGAQIGGDGSLHTLFYSAGDGGIVPHQLIYASSTDNGVSWTTTTVGTEVGDDSMSLELGALSLDSNDDPGVLYLELNNISGEGPIDVTSTVRLAKRSALGVWTTSTIYYPASAIGVSGFPKYPKLEFVGSDYPLAFHFGNNYNPVWSVSTTTDPYVYTNNTLNADVVGNNTSFGLVYVTSTEIVAMTYIDNAGQLYFATSSLSLPVGSAPTAPSNVNAFGISTSSVEYFYWTDNSSDEDGFQVGVSNDGENYNSDDVQVANTTSTIDGGSITDLLPNTYYWFHVGAYNSFGTSTFAVTSTYTNPVSPGTPTASNVSTSSLALTWEDNLNASNTVYYILYSDGTTSTVSSATTTSITGLTPNTEYQFAVRAEYLGDPGTYTTYSASSTATTTNPNIPGTPSASANGQTSMIVTWVDNDNPSGTLYRLYNTTLSSIVGTTTSTSYTVTGLSANTSYQFQVSAQYFSDNETYTNYSSASSAVSTSAVGSSVTMTLNNSASSTFQLTGGDSHTVTLQSNNGTTATLLIESTPVTVSLATGDSQNVALGSSTDTTVIMSSVSSGSATFTISTYTASSNSSSGSGTATVGPSVSSFYINSNVEETSNKVVTLFTSSPGAVQIAFSNTQDFAGVSFESFTGIKSWILTEGNGLKRVYAKVRNAQGGITLVSDTIILTGQSQNQSDNLVQEEASDVCALDHAKPYKSSGSPAVYYITDDCTKRPFKNSDMYFSYFTSWNQVVEIDAGLLQSIPDDVLGFMPKGPLYPLLSGSLVKTITDPNIYLILSNQRHLITSPIIFNSFNYAWNWIEDVASSLLAKFSRSGDIDDAQVRLNYTLIKYSNSPHIYRIESDPQDTTKQIKRKIADEETFESLKYRWDRIVEVETDEVYEDGAVIML
ncbi:MAG TPA: hypothetical protein DCS29_02505 [Candidatus Magasanikbacteria bacterium]|nr:hypothetical protein [Candidatus Magasanikbacteria bacterium]